MDGEVSKVLPEHRLKGIKSNIRLLTVIRTFLVRQPVSKVKMPVGGEKLGELIGYFLRVKPVHFDDEAIGRVIEVLGYDAGTCRPAVAGSSQASDVEQGVDKTALAYGDVSLV